MNVLKINNQTNNNIAMGHTPYTTLWKRWEALSNVIVITNGQTRPCLYFY